MTRQELYMRAKILAFLKYGPQAGQYVPHTVLLDHIKPRTQTQGERFYRAMQDLLAAGQVVRGQGASYKAII